MAVLIQNGRRRVISHRFHVGRHGCLVRNAGFTYLFALLLTAILSLSAAGAASIWHIESRRQAEVELIFIGHQFRSAIGAYYIKNKKYPMSLQDLLGTSDAVGTKARFLRKLYRDPLSDKADWGLVPAGNAGIAGVYSLSSAEPIKVAEFSSQDKTFEGASKYSEWKFIYVPRFIPTNQDGVMFPLPRP